MRYVLYLCLSILLIMISACGIDTEKSTQNKNSETKVEKDRQSRNDQFDENDNNVRNMDEFFNIGEFETLKGTNGVGTYENGPIAFDIISVLGKKDH